MNMNKSILWAIHSHLVNLPCDFRIKVCEECQFSEATFYRKMKDKKVTALSRAEKEKISSIAEGLFTGFQDFLKTSRIKLT